MNSEAQKLQKIRENIIIQIYTDISSPAEVDWYLGQMFPEKDPDKDREWFQTKALEIIQGLLETHPQIYFVSVDPEGFRPWRCAPGEVVEHIKKEWDKLGSAPMGPEAGYLSLWPMSDGE